MVTSVAEITDLYLKSCTKHGTKPLKNVLDHLKTIDLHLTRQPLLSLKAIQFTPNDCEPLEEIFKRVSSPLNIVLKNIISTHHNHILN